jgi:predicted ATPase
MRDHLPELGSKGSEFKYFPTLMAAALGRMGEFDEGLRYVDEALRFMERSGQRHYEVEVHRVKGELLLARDESNAAQSEQSFRTAIEIARTQHAKSWELRAATSLARLLRDTNRREEARAMLAEIYDWFTEGFDTADLKDAKALLDELKR